MTIDRTALLLSAQRALLGAVSTEVLGICVDGSGGAITVLAYCAGTLNDDERDALDAVGTEIGADFPDVATVRVLIEEQAEPPLPRRGDWVFLRYDCTVE